MQTCRICDAHSADELRYCGTCGEPLRDDVPTKQRGRPSDVIPAGTEFGSYRLLEVIGEGGMGRVYLAEHIRLGRKVALKMLRSKYSQNPEAVRRFFTEARAVNRIAHENIVEVTDFVSDPDGSSYYIMELLTGGTLFDLIHQEQIVPLERALAISSQVANALAVVHEAGIIHRDLKPDNIFLAQRGTRTDLVKLLDFGIAKLIEPETGISMQRTGAGTLMGTPAYMSPEQASAGPVDHRSDIYALGVILYELTTGVVPFQGGSYGEILVQHLTQTPRRPSTRDNQRHAIPADLEKLILHCLAKDVAARPQSMREVEERLRAVLAQMARGEAIMTGPTWPAIPAVVPAEPQEDTVESPVATGKGRVLRIAAAAAVALAAAGLGARALWPAGENDGAGRAAETAGQGTEALSEAPPESTPGSPGSPGSSGSSEAATRAELAAPPAIAASPADAGEDAAPADDRITLTIRSSPSGAEVLRAGEAEPLGLTPLEMEVERSDAPVAFEIRKPGFAPVSQSVKLAEDVFISVGLTAAPPPPPAAGKAPPRQDGSRDSKPDSDPAPDARASEATRRAQKRLEKNGVIDAFGEYDGMNARTP